MASEAKVVVIALLILAVGFFYTNARDRMAGYASVKQTIDMEEYRFAAEEPYQTTEIDQTLPIEQRSKPQKEEPTKEVSLQEVFASAQIVDPCSTDVPQLQTLVGGVC